MWYQFSFIWIMSLAQSVVLNWIGVCVFMVLLSLKLESKGQYLWFVVFVPLFIIRFIDFMWLLVRIVTHARTYTDPQDVTMKRKAWYVVAVFLEVVFEILLCIRLDEFAKISLYLVMIPLWLLLIGHMINFFRYQLSVIRR